MKRSRPKQHTRRLKSGRVIKVNRGVKAKRKSFTPFGRSEKAVEMTAARRFGGQNLKGLKKLGQGRDRVVFALDKDKVLKVAKNPGGLTQNTSEGDVEFLDLGKHYETGLDYAVMQRNEPLSQKNKRQLREIRKQAEEASSGYANDDIRGPLSEEKGALAKSSIGTGVLDFGFNHRELFANRQWGQDKEGNLKLNDGGALQDNVSLRRHRIKDFQQVANIDRNKAPPWQLKDWNETQNQRRQFKTKGSYKEPFDRY